MKKTIAMLTALIMTAALAVPLTVSAAPDDYLPLNPISNVPTPTIIPNGDGNASAAGDPQITPASQSQTGDTTVTYSEQEMYFVTIPAKVELADTAKTADIKFSDVMLNKGSKISVTLDDAANKGLSTSSDFNVAQTDTSIFATYTVTDGASTPTVYKLKDEVASFVYGTKDAQGALIKEATETLTFTAPQGANYAGTYTDTLTFKIAVEDAVTPYTPQTYTSLTVGTVLHVGDTLDLTEGLDLERGTLNSNYIWTLVRGNINGKTCTESDNGDCYVFKGVFRTSDTTVYMVYDAIPVTAASDGITVTALNGSNVRFAVHES